MLSKEQFQQLRDKGLSVNQIVGFEKGNTPQQTSSFSQNLNPMIQERTKNLQGISDATTSGQQGFAQGAFQTGGELLGAAFDPFVAGLKTITPDIIKKPLSQGLKTLSQGIQSAANVISDIPAVQDFAMNPQSKNFERNVKALNEYLVLLAPQVKGSSKILGNLTSSTGETIKESGVKGLATLKGKFVRNLISPEKTSKVALEEVGRTSIQGFGPFKKNIITPSIREANAIKEVVKIPKISRRKTFQQNYNIIVEAIKQEAQNLTSNLLKHDFNYPRRELLSKLNDTRKILAENPLLVGSAEKTASKMINKVEQLLNEAPAKGSNLLIKRQQYDRWIENQKGQGIFEPKNENALSIANREIRQTVNRFLDEKAHNVDVTKSLQRQTSLYHAIGNIAPKAAKEFSTPMGRLFQKVMEKMGLKNQIVQILGTGVGMAGFGAASRFAPAVAFGAIPFYLTYRAGKMILRPELRILVGNMLKTYGSQLTKEEVSLIKSLLAEEVIINSNKKIQ